jgi:hypothetical protein
MDAKYALEITPSAKGSFVGSAAGTCAALPYGLSVGSFAIAMTAVSVIRIAGASVGATAGAAGEAGTAPASVPIAAPGTGVVAGAGAGGAVTTGAGDVGAGAGACPIAVAAIDPANDAASRETRLANLMELRGKYSGGGESTERLPAGLRPESFRGHSEERDESVARDPVGSPALRVRDP